MSEEITPTEHTRASDETPAQVGAGHNDQAANARLREHLCRGVSPAVRILHENGRVIALMDGRGVASEGTNLEDVLQDLVLTLREYSQDWDDRLKHAPNHVHNRDLVQLVALSTNDELLQWLDWGGK
jgi:hypothetical protein